MNVKKMCDDFIRHCILDEGVITQENLPTLDSRLGQNLNIGQSVAGQHQQTPMVQPPKPASSKPTPSTPASSTPAQEPPGEPAEPEPKEPEEEPKDDEEEGEGEEDVKATMDSYEAAKSSLAICEYHLRSLSSMQEGGDSNDVFDEACKAIKKAKKTINEMKKAMRQQETQDGDEAGDNRGDQV